MLGDLCENFNCTTGLIPLLVSVQSSCILLGMVILLFFRACRGLFLPRPTPSLALAGTTTLLGLTLLQSCMEMVITSDLFTLKFGDRDPLTHPRWQQFSSLSIGIAMLVIAQALLSSTVWAFAQERLGRGQKRITLGLSMTVIVLLASCALSIVAAIRLKTPEGVHWALPRVDIGVHPCEECGGVIIAWQIMTALLDTVFCGLMVHGIASTTRLHNKDEDHRCGWMDGVVNAAWVIFNGGALLAVAQWAAAVGWIVIESDDAHPLHLVWIHLSWFILPKAHVLWYLGAYVEETARAQHQMHSSAHSSELPKRFSISSYFETVEHSWGQGSSCSSPDNALGLILGSPRSTTSSEGTIVVTGLPLACHSPRNVCAEPMATAFVETESSPWCVSSRRDELSTIYERDDDASHHESGAGAIVFVATEGEGGSDGSDHDRPISMMSSLYQPNGQICPWEIQEPSPVHQEPAHYGFHTPERCHHAAHLKK